MEPSDRPLWKLTEVASPHIDRPVSVIVAKDVPYTPNANRFQNLRIYLPKTPENSLLIGCPVELLPGESPTGIIPRWHVHIHGGAWRDPQLTSTSIEPAVAHAFSASDPAHKVSAVVSLNYTLSPFPTHPTLPYDPTIGELSDPSREAYHPDHVHDIIRGFALLRSLGLRDGSYILSGHSAGGCLAFQSILQPASYWGADNLPDPPRPAAILGMNGLYDLPGLVHHLGASHAGLNEVYQNFLGISFGLDESKWVTASPASFPINGLAERMSQGKLPSLVVIDQSKEDQLVPMNQADKLENHLGNVTGLQLVRGDRCKGRHAAPWEEGYMIWESVQDVLNHFAK